MTVPSNNATQNLTSLPASPPAPAQPGASAGPAGAPPSQGSTSWLVTIAPFVTLAVVIGMVVFVTHRWELWSGQAAVQNTDNAYVKSDIAGLKTKVGGYVRAVYVSDYEAVRAGTVIAEIGDEDYHVALASAKASLASAQATLDNTNNEIDLQNAAIAQALATLDAAKATLNKSILELKRQQQLGRQGVSSVQTLEGAEASYVTAQADVTKSAAAVDYQRRQLNVLNGNRRERQAQVDAASANVDSAQLDLTYTKIVAPFDGVVSGRNVQPGDHIAASTQVMSIIPLPHVYVIANYKETQLTHVEEGQPVDIKVDSFPDEEIRGRVAKIAPAAGSEFALLPADNATGNFTKVVQRIPVRIEIDPSQNTIRQLRPGMSVTTKIDTDGKKIGPYDEVQPLRKIREMGGDVDVKLD